MGGCINIEWPNNRIYKFDGNLTLDVKTAGVLNDSELPSPTLSQRQIPVNVNNVLLRGMSLKNTEEVIGCIVYTGHDTKIQKNNAKRRYKTSRLMKITNRQIIMIFIAQFILSSIGSFIGTTWMIDNINNKYLDFD